MCIAIVASTQIKPQGTIPVAPSEQVPGLDGYGMRLLELGPVQTWIRSIDALSRALPSRSHDPIASYDHDTASLSRCPLTGETAQQ